MIRSSRVAYVAWFAAVALLPVQRAEAVQNWFGYGGIFGPRAYYTYYAPQPVVATTYQIAPAPSVAYGSPTVIAAPPVTYSTARVVIPATAYAPLSTAYAPLASYRPVVAYSPSCGSYCGSSCVPAAVAPPATIPQVIVPGTVAPPPAAIAPSLPTRVTPVYPPPGVYPPAAAPTTVVPAQPTVTPGLPTSGLSPADQPPTLSGYPPIGGYSVTAPPMYGADAAPTAPAGPEAASSGAAGKPEGAETSSQHKPDLDISIPDAGDEMVPAESPDDAAADPPAGADDNHTAQAHRPRTTLLSTATWRAARPAHRRTAVSPAPGAHRNTK